MIRDTVIAVRIDDHVFSSSGPLTILSRSKTEIIATVPTYRYKYSLCIVRLLKSLIRTLFSRLNSLSKKFLYCHRTL